jgi:hypothetical protein
MDLQDGNESLQEYLDNKIFAGQAGQTLEPDEAMVEGFDAFMKKYMAGLEIEKAAVSSLN